jgi:hypothetical protein
MIVMKLNRELTHITSSLSIEDNYNNNIDSNASSPLSSPPSSPNLENEAENDSEGKDDVIEPLLLPDVVWVNDEKRGWWPSEVNNNKKEIVIFLGLSIFKYFFIWFNR